MNPSADYLFASIAGSFTSRAVGVVLSGFLNDGARGIRLIHELGGRTLVQSPATAVAPDMPNAAIATGCVEFVVPLEGLSSALMGIVGQN
jgi:two-component system chemotaxis response regulator CheB